MTSSGLGNGSEGIKTPLVMSSFASGSLKKFHPACKYSTVFYAGYRNPGVLL